MHKVYEEAQRLMTKQKKLIARFGLRLNDKGYSVKVEYITDC